MTENEYNNRMRLFQIGDLFANYRLDEDEIMRLGEEIKDISGVCRQCRGEGLDGDGEGPQTTCEHCSGKCFV